MRTNWKFLFLVALILVSISSCVKDAGGIDDPENGTELESSMTAKVNGVDAFSSLDIAAQTSTQVGAVKTIVIGGEDGDQDISMFIYDFDGVGVYTEKNNNPNFTNVFQYKIQDSILVNGEWQTYPNVWSTNSGLESYGIVSITSVTEAYVDGTFEFRGGGGFGADSLVISDGQFHARRY